jgi:hypothetical protein
MPVPSDRLQKLEERQRRLCEQIERARAAADQQERKRDARRKIIVGAMVLGLVERGEWPRERLLAKLDEHLSRKHDRALFGLPPRENAVDSGDASDSEGSPVDAVA